MRRPGSPLLACLLPAWLLLASCAAQPPAAPAVETPVEATERRRKAPRPAYNLAGYPPAVRDGYIDGCESAKKSEFGRKDAKRFAADARYRLGWNDGFAICTPK